VINEDGPSESQNGKSKSKSSSGNSTPGNEENTP
jgi:hypothetical protein